MESCRQVDAVPSSTLSGPDLRTDRREGAHLLLYHGCPEAEESYPLRSRTGRRHERAADQPSEVDRGTTGQGNSGYQASCFDDTVTESNSVFAVDDCADIIMSSYAAAVELAPKRTARRSTTTVQQLLQLTTELPAASIWFPAASTSTYVNHVPDFDAARQPLRWIAAWIWTSSSRMFNRGTVGCHSFFHSQDAPPASSRPQSPGPGSGNRRRRNIGCYVCGRYGCHSANHPDQSWGPPPQRPPSTSSAGNQPQGNAFRGPMAGSRTPSSDRPQSR